MLVVSLIMKLVVRIRFLVVLHGVGVAVVTALSSWLEVRVWRDGKEASVFADGAPTTGLLVKEVGGDRHGTEVTFYHQRYFLFTEFCAETIETWLREQSYLNANVKIVFEDLRGSEKEDKRVSFKDGLKGFAVYLINLKKN